MTDEELDAMAEREPDLDGFCGFCQRTVSNAKDPDHRVTPILKGGRGVECKQRGDHQ